MINLQEAIPFAEGGNRVCYTNPEDKSMCLKISKLDAIRSIRANAPWYKKLRSTKSFDDNFREERAYKQRAVKETEHGLTLNITDGLGCMSFIPLPEISSAFAKRYVNKRIQLMNSRIEWDLSGRTGDWK